ncbi:histone-lysine N-methyltransferase EZA1 isoform X2 [Macadamia integrifolia]|uniref:histone-lysine N-methyltransferase EZA1 isoform X2 n=2 Tax=Macadamia integrifolia TaxID=60698 RepID=UPI001C50154A|nr:histone-lysine N-methyltransferase EZA1 isoform X2 [Macadamia integrifolia]
MVSKETECSYTIKEPEGEQANEAFGNISAWISQLKKQIQASRVASIKEKLERNGKDLQHHTSQLQQSAMSKQEQNGSKNMLTFRIGSPLYKFNGSVHGSGEKDYINSHEVLSPTVIKVPYIEKIPPYTTWIFLDKNQRMAEDQSVVGRRQIYYDQYGSEALICSDSEEEIAEPEEEKHEFSEGEDQILWKVIQEYGLNREVLNIVSEFIGATASEIQERYNTLIEQHPEKQPEKLEASAERVSERNIFLGKSLTAALDSFDNLFCRRCLVFDCRLHGCSQSLVVPSEKQPNWCETEENGRPCSNQCFLQVMEGGRDVLQKSDTSTIPGNNSRGVIADGRCSYRKRAADDSPEVSIEALNINTSVVDISSYEDMGSDEFQGSAIKKQKKILDSDGVSVGSEDLPVDLASSANIMCSVSEVFLSNEHQKTNESSQHTCIVTSDENNEGIEHPTNSTIEMPIKQSSNSRKGQSDGALSGCEWKPIEKELYLKGIEIFGKNSCLIARNLLPGLKTCMEVFTYMAHDGAAISLGSDVQPNACLEDNGKADTEYMEQEVPTRSRLFRRRGRARKLKYTWKSVGHPSIRKRIADGKNQSCKQYTPCACQPLCGKQCPCLHNGTCCEKYCGCSKSCKNRFRGCHCAKSQCRSRQCPCFAAGRECDPDVCRNCWVSCGDGSLGEPPGRGDGYQCGNMKLLLKQQQRILLGRSDVAGWGAFIKNSVNKNDYLGEYTGELISHREADKRGKIYDRANSSFLFDLNDQSVLDAYRKGDKLKFANHSSNPNCYAKVMLVAGDHRVGIFAKEHIEASEELFYDYRYGPDHAPAWARKPEGSKRDDSLVSHGRAQKHQSH